MTFANSRDTAEAQRRIPNRTGGIQVVYCGVDLKRFSPDHAAQGERLRRDLGIVPGAPVVGMVGRFERWKGQHVFLRAAAHVRRRFPETVFLVVGDTLFGLQPGYKTELEQLALELGLKDSVRFLGFREDMPALYAAMDVVVHASTTPEPLGLVILEAMACARAVVAADAGGPRETVLDGVTGFLTPPGDPESLAERLISLLEDPAQRSRMGQAGRRRVEECFGMDRMARLLEDAYLGVAGAQS
jgi:glycosyltransferase involved in cell wall biosynthesis